MYANYGDLDFFEYGILVKPESETAFNILHCVPVTDSDGKYMFSDCYIDIDDSWIDKQAVMSFIDMNDQEFDNILYAIGCIEYYGTYEFTGGYEKPLMNKEEIKNELKLYGIEL